jgi:hypothetical protein
VKKKRKGEEMLMAKGPSLDKDNFAWEGRDNNIREWTRDGDTMEIKL